MTDLELLLEEWIKLGVALRQVDKVVASESYRSDYPYPGAFVDNVRHLHQILKTCILPNRIVPAQWEQLEQECRAALKTVETYRAPGFQGNPMVTFQGAGLNKIIAVPDVIETIQMKVQAKLRAEQTIQEQPQSRSRARRRS